MFLKKLIGWGDKFEDRVRGALSRYPIIYGLVAGGAVVIFWRGIWHTWDYLASAIGIYGGDEISLWDGPLAIVFGTTILLATGVLVSEFIGEQIIISGLKGEKKVVDKTRQEIETEENILREIKNKVDKIEQDVAELSAEKK